MPLVLATRNQHKTREIAHILEQPTLSLDEIGFQGEIVETGLTFRDNARIKVEAVARFLCASAAAPHDAGPWTILADDSGLEVDALAGAPGVFSARYAGAPADDAANNRKLLSALHGVPGSRRGAQFHCVLATLSVSRDEDGGTPTEVRFFDGICRGKIGYRPKGFHGFGYDPIFFPEGFCRTFGELPAEVKNRMSHRARALAAFKAWLQPPRHGATKALRASVT